jgi:hypothetical protein
VSCNSTDAKGEKTAYCANNQKGILILVGNGNFAQTIVAGGRKDASSPGLASLFGTWSVNEADKTLTRHVVGDNVPALDGGDFKTTVSLNGEEMRLVGTTDNGGHLEGTYRRFK